MLRWLLGDAKRQEGSQALSDIANALWDSYQEKLLPLEREYDFAQFHSKELTEADFSARPMVLLLGQYSTGKTTLIRHLLGRDYPGLRIGPEPTTEKFVAVAHGETARDTVIPGHTVVSDPAMPFTQLGHFGDGFLSRFECTKIRSPVLEGITIIDTPGVLAGEKQRLKRSYDFEAVTKWFADRVDMILLLFDVSKLDISDEFRRIILSVKGNENKLRIILNKADIVTTPQLMPVYGALTWSLGKIIDTPEMSRVYVGSYWDKPLQNAELRRFFEAEENELYYQLTQLPRGAALNKLNELVRRARLARIHVNLLSALRQKMPTFWRKSRAQQDLISNLRETYEELSRERNLPMGDFPSVASMQEKLASVDITRFAKLDPVRTQGIEELLAVDIPDMLGRIPEEHDHSADVIPVRRMARRSRSRSRSRRVGRRSRSSSRSRNRGAGSTMHESRGGSTSSSGALGIGDGSDPK